MNTFFTCPAFFTMVKNMGGETADDVQSATDRFRRLNDAFVGAFGVQPSVLVSTPGRVELCGNHTDHNHGRVLAASIQLDSIAAAAASSENIVTLRSQGYAEPFRIDLKYLDRIPEEAGTTAALVRGIAARFRHSGYAIGGFTAAVMSDVLPGSGLSSSASIEVLLGTIFNALFNDGRIEPAQLAHIGQFAENVYFGKPCGLMDQLTCALGGIVSFDFADPATPVTRTFRSQFEERGLALLVVHTGGNHVDLTAEYAAVPKEMKDVAHYLGYTVCRDLQFNTVLQAIPLLRPAVGDRAILRAIHFLSENERVSEQVQALDRDDIDEFLRLMNASGSSSSRWLQNCSPSGSIREQGVTLALALSEWFIHSVGRGACRVHGGGFAGTILTVIPADAVPAYMHMMTPVFGDRAITRLRIRNVGTLALPTSQ